MTAWTAFYWGDYLRDTQDLDLLQHGAYFKLLAHYYSTGGPLPEDDSALYRICGAFSKTEQNAVKSVVRRFFRKADDGVRNDRADTEIAKREEIAKRRSEAGKQGAASKHGRGNVSQFPGK